MNLKQSLKILELENPGSIHDARRAYKDLVRVWHPDRFQSNPRLKQKAEKKLREINLAFNFLRDYMASNHAGEAAVSQIPPPQFAIRAKDRQLCCQIGAPQA